MEMQKSEVFLVIVAVLVLALWANRESDHNFQQKHPAIIRLSEEDARYSFETGSYELTPAYRRALRGMVPKILELLRECRCDTLEVIGTADNMPLATTSDFDMQIHSMLRDEASVVAAGSSNDLSLLRAVAVLTFLRSIPDLNSVRYWAPLSRAQTLFPDGTLDLVGNRVSDPARRSIEIRFMSSGAEVDEHYVYTAFAPHAISTAAEAVGLARLMKRGGDREDCVLFLLDEQYRLISAHGRVGTEEMCRVEYPDEVPEDTAGVLIAHDHPGGAARLSSGDRNAVPAHRSRAESLGLELLDVIVWTETEYSSLEDFGVRPLQRAAVFFGATPRQAPVPRPRERPESLVWPLEGRGRVLSGFGWRKAPKGSVGHEFHDGIDISAAAGTGIRALGDGTVWTVSENARGGRVVELDLASGWSVFYAHLDEVSVEPGTDVAEGEVIGTVGSTGLGSQPSLHLVVKDSGALFDPMPTGSFTVPKRK